jgi:phage terminase small subunit
MKVRPLTIKQAEFVAAMIELKKPIEAYRLVYSKTCNDSTAYTQASKLLQNPKIAGEIKKHTDLLAAKAQMTVTRVLEHYAELATADPNDLASVRWICCRHCYGRGHKYQWIDDEEWALAAANAMVAGAAPGAVSDEGGYGFNRTLEPHPDCPRCHGEGTSEVHIADTRKLQGPARRLYAGAKYGKHGIEVSMRSQDKALEMLARILKMTTPKDEGEGDDGVLVIKGGLPTAADLKP